MSAKKKNKEILDFQDKILPRKVEKTNECTPWQLSPFTEEAHALQLKANDKFGAWAFSWEYCVKLLFQRSRMNFHAQLFMPSPKTAQGKTVKMWLKFSKAKSKQMDLQLKAHSTDSVQLVLLSLWRSYVMPYEGSFVKSNNNDPEDVLQ